MQSFFAALVQSDRASFNSLLDSLISTAKGSASGGSAVKQAFYSIAQCVAVLCIAAGDPKCSSTVEMLINMLKGSKNCAPVGGFLIGMCIVSLFGFGLKLYALFVLNTDDTPGVALPWRDREEKGS